MNINPRNLVALVISFALLQCLGLAQGQDEEKLKRAHQEGRRVAAEDLKNDKLVYHIGGPPAPWDQLFIEILREEYKVGVGYIGCVISTEGFQHGLGYNEVSVPEIEKRYGKGILRRAEERARAKYQKSQEDSRKDGKP